MRNPGLNLAIILGPILFVVLIGLAFQSSSLVSEIKLGLYEEGDGFVKEIFSKQPQITIKEYSSEEHCKKDLNLHVTHACLIITKTSDKNSTNKEVNVYFDYSRSSLVLAISDSIKKILDNVDKEISFNILQNIRNEVDPSNSNLGSIRKNLNALKTNIDSSISDMANLRKDLKSEASSADNNLEDSKAKLDDLQDTLTEYKQELLETEQNVGDYKSSVSTIRSGVGTFDNNAYNLWATDCGYSGTDYYPAIVSSSNTYTEISTDSDSYCSLVSTSYHLGSDYHSKIQNLENELLNIESKLSQTRRDLGNAQDDIEKYKRDIDQNKEDAGERFKELDEYVLNKQLEMMEFSNSINEYKAQLQSVETGMTALYQALDPKNIVNPLKSYTSSSFGQKSNLDYTLPVVLSFVIMLTSLLLGVTVRQKEKHSSATKRNTIFSNMTSIFIGNYLFVLILVFFELMLLLVGFYFFGANSIHGFHYILAVSFFYTTIWILIGFFIGGIFESQEGSMFTGISLGLVIFLLSDVLVPLEKFPFWLKEIATYNPYFVFSEISRINYLALEYVSFLNQKIFLLICLPIVLILANFLLHKFQGEFDE